MIFFGRNILSFLTIYFSCENLTIKNKELTIILTFSILLFPLMQAVAYFAFPNILILVYYVYAQMKYA